MSQYQQDLHQARADVVATAVRWRRARRAGDARRLHAQEEHESAIDRLIRLRGGK